MGDGVVIPPGRMYQIIKTLFIMNSFKFYFQHNPNQPHITAYYHNGCIVLHGGTSAYSTHADVSRGELHNDDSLDLEFLFNCAPMESLEDFVSTVQTYLTVQGY